MESLKKCILIFVFGILAIGVDAQETEINNLVDSVATVITEPVKVHLPRKATVYSAVLPGLGQVYNGQWWKVPFIYGGFGGIGYMINDMNNNYKSYKNALIDLSDKNPVTNSYQQYMNEYDPEVDELSPPSNLQTKLMNGISGYSRLRNLYMIGAAGFYLINILDANVNAHFIDFDISEDLTLNLSPVATDPMTNLPVPGMTLVFNF